MPKHALVLLTVLPAYCTPVCELLTKYDLRPHSDRGIIHGGQLLPIHHRAIGAVQVRDEDAVILCV